MSMQQMFLAASGGGPKKYIDESFDISTFIGSAQYRSIHVNRGNGAAADGYACWIQNRSSSGWGSCFGNTLAGTGKRWDMHTDNGMTTDTNAFSNFSPNSNFLQIGTSDECNRNNDEYVSWTWSKQAGFFDMFSYTGNGSGNRTLSHNLGATVGAALWMPAYSAGSGANRYFWHRKTGSGVGLVLNSTNGATTNWITNASSTSITVNSALNESGKVYNLHLWAHDDQSFGENGDESVCYCGVIDENSGGTSQKITLGWQPRWILIKCYQTPDSSGSNAVGLGNWVVIDNARNMGPTHNNNFILQANLNNAEHRSNMFIHPVSDGFWTEGMSYYGNQRMIFMAIRDSGDKPYGDKNGVGDDLVEVTKFTGDGQNGRQIAFGTGFKIAAGLHCGIDKYNTPDRYGGFTSMRNFVARQAGTSMRTAYGYDSGQPWNDRSNPRDYFPTIDLVSSKIVVGNDSDFNTGSNGAIYFATAFQKLRGLMDIVTYKGSSSTQSIRHHLGTTPRVMWVGGLENGDQQGGYFADVPNANQKSFFLNKRSVNYGIYNGTTTYNAWASTSPTATHFTVASGYTSTNNNGKYHVAILFADQDGRSKSGGWDGNSSVNRTITLGFYPKILFIWNLKPSSSSPSEQGGDGSSFMLVPSIDSTKNFMMNDYWMSGGSYNYYASFIPNGQTYKRSDAQWTNPSQFPNHSTNITYSGTGFTVSGYLNTTNRSYYYLALK